MINVPVAKPSKKVKKNIPNYREQLYEDRASSDRPCDLFPLFWKRVMAIDVLTNYTTK